MPPRKSANSAGSNTVAATSRGSKRKFKDIESDPEPLNSSTERPGSKKSVLKGVKGGKEKEHVEREEPPRLKRYRLRCPQAVEQRLERVRTQRMFCLGRARREEDLTEEFKIAGSTGNVYTVTLANIPTCNCPDSKKNGTCKHILFVMSKVLRVRYNLSYQAALLNSEIQEIFENSPVPPQGEPSGTIQTRKPLDEDDCADCFRQWVASKMGGTVTCVMCRTPWDENSAEEGEYGEILRNAEIGREGYLNVAEQMGLSTYRGEYRFPDIYSLPTLLTSPST
ncbi:hypothetical protein ABW19_dt0210631 [Dactylella cylindrospora]|nr:hypothetical protein ABW19_dt0210631 [Dactylella cylindrospora]